MRASLHHAGHKHIFAYSRIFLYFSPNILKQQLSVLHTFRRLNSLHLIFVSSIFVSSLLIVAQTRIESDSTPVQSTFTHFSCYGMSSIDNSAASTRTACFTSCENTGKCAFSKSENPSDNATVSSSFGYWRVLLKKCSEWLVFIPSKSSLLPNSASGASSDKSHNYEFMKHSNYIFLCGGHFRTTRIVRPNFTSHGPKFSVLPFTILAVTFPMVLYLVFEAAWLWNHVSPAVVVVFCYCWCVLMNCLLRAALMDPGVLPRNVHLVDNVVKNGLPEEYHSWIQMPGPRMVHDATKTDAKKTPDPVSAPIYAKYCNSCFIWRPARASHCSRCNVCIANLDHHCPWLSNCVGQRNHCYFIGFLVFACIECSFLAASSFYIVAIKSANRARMSLFLGIFACLGLLYPLLLLISHLLLGFFGITTREYLNTERHSGNSHLKDLCLSPFNLGSPTTNFYHQWFRPRGASNFRVLSRRTLDDGRLDQVVIGGLDV